MLETNINAIIPWNYFIKKNILDQNNPEFDQSQRFNFGHINFNFVNKRILAKQH